VFNRFFDLSIRQRLLIYGVVAVSLVFLYALFVYLPRSTEITEKKQRLRDLESQYAQLRASLQDREKLEAEIAEVESQFNKAKAQLPEQKEIPELLRQVSNLGRESGLEVTLFRQQTERLLDLYAEVPVEVAVRGGYHQIAIFFEKVRLLDRIVNVNDISMKNPQMKDGQIQVEASFAATTYRFLSEAEREQVAKQKAEAEKSKSGNPS
jgi:type IV pilus assembly protein PilO